MPVDAEELEYPALGFLADGTLKVVASATQLTLNTRYGLRGGYYSGLRIVDSSGRWFIVRSAKKLRGLSGYTLLLNQWIQVGLELEDTKRQAELDEVQKMVLADFEAWDGWSSRGDFDLLVRRVKGARTLSELLRVLSTMVK